MKKDIKFSTRMSSADREAIKVLAKQSGMSMSDYVTVCCLGKQVVVIDGLKEVLKLRQYHHHQNAEEHHVRRHPAQRGNTLGNLSGATNCFARLV